MLTWLLLLAILQAPEPPQGSLVTQVRIEAPGEDLERLQRYIAVPVGRPLSTSAVRESVSLLFATGAFADVIVEKHPQPGGLLVLFRTTPAPRLRRVEVAGQRVLKAGRLREITRLRPREAVWPARLSRAARDCEVALARSGYLDAQVRAEAVPVEGGADARFTITAGNRARVRGLSLRGLSPAATQRLARWLRPRSGQPFERARAEKAAEALRQELVSEGRWAADVQIEEAYDARLARVDLTFVVEPDRPVRAELRGSDAPAGLEREVNELLREGQLSRDALEEALEHIEEHYRNRGHRDVLVSYRDDDDSQGALRVVVYDIDAGPRTLAASVSVDGIELPVRLATRPDHPVVDRLLDEDIEGLTEALREQGHVSPHVFSDVREGGGTVPVVFRVRPGPQTLVSEVELESPPDAGVDVSAQLRLRVGEPYRLRDLARDRTTLLGAYREAGFLQVSVEPEVSFGEERRTAAVVFDIDPGERTRVGQVIVAGLQQTREEVVWRELSVEQGQPLGLQQVLESQRRLAGLGIFSRVDIRELDSERPSEQHLLITAEEAPRHTLAYGLGYSGREKLRASLELTRRNLLGLDRSVTLFARGSFKSSRVFATYRVPYSFGFRRELFLTGFWEEDDREGFDFTRVGTLLQTPIDLSDTLKLIPRLSYQRTETYNVEVPCEEVDRRLCDSTVSGPSASIINDTRDDPLDPHSGRFLGADLQLSLDSLGGDGFAKAFLQAAFFAPAGDRLVLALDGRLGVSRTLGPGRSERLPLPERFFLGGDFGLRGFETDAVDISGGNALLYGAAEMRFDAGRDFSLAAFGELGNIYPLTDNLRLRDLRYTAGVGLRYLSALGPLRVDWGFKLDRRSGESPSEWHFTVGHAF